MLEIYSFLRAHGFILSLNSLQSPTARKFFKGGKLSSGVHADFVKNDPPVSSSIKNVSLFISIKLWRRRRRNQLFANFFMAGPVYYVHTFVCAHVIICALAKSIKWRTQHFPLLFLRRPAARIYFTRRAVALYGPLAGNGSVYFIHVRERAPRLD